MTLKELRKIVVDFRDARDWRQFHTPKDLVISMMVEVGEVADHFKWKNDEELESYLKSHKAEIADELADVLHNLVLTADELDIDLEKAFKKKICETEEKYPVEKARGNNKKYNKL
jgi:NTP pyrophosphatase (non-canonical NTP hydrolase)